MKRTLRVIKMKQLRGIRRGVRRVRCRNTRSTSRIRKCSSSYLPEVRYVCCCACEISRWPHPEEEALKGMHHVIAPDAAMDCRSREGRGDIAFYWEESI